MGDDSSPRHHPFSCTCIAARHHRPPAAALREPCSTNIRIREYRKDTDTLQVQKLECSSPSSPHPPPPPPGGSLFLLPTSPLGDPLSRVRTYPLFCMMVAEVRLADGDDNECSKSTIVGVVRAGLKQVTTRHSSSHGHDRRRKDCVSLAYISGLRVAHGYRRLGIAQKLMNEVEEWCRKQGAEYCYLATQKENEASVNLFTLKLGYAKFRTPLILVQPVAHNSRATTIHSMAELIRVVKLDTNHAEVLYRTEMGDKEFFPKDIEQILQSPLNAGTWAAYYDNDERGVCRKAAKLGGGGRHGDTEMMGERGGGKGWAMLSLWRYDKLIRFEAAPATKTGASGRWLAAALKRLGKRVVPGGGKAAEGFGVQLVYGVHAAGDDWKEPLERLWSVAGEAAAAEGCRAVVTELAAGDPLREGLPHASCHHDLWYAKRLLEGVDWPLPAAAASSFLDPRDF